MALLTDVGNRVPEGAIRLTEEEALEHQRTVINDWPSQSEVTFLRYGSSIVAAANLFTSGVIANYFREYLRIRAKYYILTFFPGVLVPGIMGYYMTDKRVTNPILLMKKDCPICMQMKFALSQFYTGIAYPAAYSYVSFAGVAMVTKSYPLPDFHSEARKFWKVSFGIFKKGTRMFHIAGLVQTIVVLFLPYLQSKELVTVMNKLYEREKEVQDSSSETTTWFSS